MANELLEVTYESALGNVQLNPATVRQYLVKGQGNVSDQECYLFIKLCQAQKLNPFTNECYLIKFGSQPAQMVVGYDTYKRRAEDNPQHLFTESGIIVCRGSSGDIVQKRGACLYPSEMLVGGWCSVHKLKGEREVVTYKEVTLSEYNKGNSIWKEKPCTMIEKVAISQALREAYPKDFEGLYSDVEIQQTNFDDAVSGQQETVLVEGKAEAVNISKIQRQQMFATAKEVLGETDGNQFIKDYLESNGLKSSTNMTVDQFIEVMGALNNIEAAMAEETAAEETTGESD